MTFGFRAACIAVLCALSAIALVAQGKSNKGPAKWPGTVSFRCTTYGCAETVTPVDAILGDGSNYAFVLNTGDQTAGAGVYNGGDMHINLGSPSAYAVTLDFTRPFQGHNGCSSYPAVPQECFPSTGQLLTINTATEIQARLTNAAGVDLGIGFEAMPKGSNAFARVRFDYRSVVDGVNLLWRVRFNKLDYAGADDMLVVRRADLPCTWVLTSQGDDLAGVWTGKDIGRKKAVRLDFGLYSMPVQMTLNVFDAPGCPARTW